jgi:hypothetical protein
VLIHLNELRNILTLQVFNGSQRLANQIVSLSITQVSEAGNSYRMEKLGFTKTLNDLYNQNVTIEQITTDRHKQIRKYIKEEQPDISHQFDIWHFCKNIKTKLVAASKKSSCTIIQKWIKSICNHLWWSCATCDGDEELLREKWISVLFHIQNKHKWSGSNKFWKCEHPRLTKKKTKTKEWIKPDSGPFKMLQSIVLNKTLLGDLKHLAQFYHTGSLEVYHSLYNKCAPKSQHFSYIGMITRSQLAVLDFNQGSNLEQATTKKGNKRYNVNFSKITGTWSSKPINKSKDNVYLHKMIEQTLDCASKGLTIELPKIPKNLPENIAKIAKPDKKELIANQVSRFKI